MKLTRGARSRRSTASTCWPAAPPGTPALVGKFLIEEIARIPVEVDYGSEYRYRDPIVSDRVLAVGISQSGETADTLSAMEAARERGAHLFAICNVVGSQATRISDGVIYTHAGPEIGVASTKAFTTQLVALYLLALYLRRAPVRQDRTALPGRPGPPAAGDRRGHPAPGAAHGRAGPASTTGPQNFLYLGRGINYPIALEGALKLKEISYIHAEGYPAGEMKHGPIALIDENMPVVAIATGDQVSEKVKSNMQEVNARDGIVIAVTDRDPEELGGICDEVIEVPSISPLPPADRQRDPAPAPRLLHRRAARGGRGPAAESGEECDGGVGDDSEPGGRPTPRAPPG